MGRPRDRLCKPYPSRGHATTEKATEARTSLNCSPMRQPTLEVSEDIRISMSSFLQPRHLCSQLVYGVRQRTCKMWQTIQAEFTHPSDVNMDHWGWLLPPRRSGQRSNRPIKFGASTIRIQGLRACFLPRQKVCPVHGPLYEGLQACQQPTAQQQSNDAAGLRAQWQR